MGYRTTEQESRQMEGFAWMLLTCVAAFRSIKSFPLEVMKGRKIPKSRIKGTRNTLSVVVFVSALILTLGFLVKAQFFPARK